MWYFMPQIFILPLIVKRKSITKGLQPSQNLKFSKEELNAIQYTDTQLLKEPDPAVNKQISIMD